MLGLKNARDCLKGFGLSVDLLGQTQILAGIGTRGAEANSAAEDAAEGASKSRHNHITGNTGCGTQYPAKGPGVFRRLSLLKQLIDSSIYGVILCF
jgi:hypothetical protein